MDISEIKFWVKTAPTWRQSQWFHCSGFDVYLRYAKKFLGAGRFERCLVIASIEKQAGVKTPVEVYLAAIEEFALELNCPVYIENILNERFYQKLLGFGYYFPGDGVPLYCLIKEVSE